ncbi:adenine deaminase [Puia dinghuensis]|uniref:Adenine deaminase n=1 Tax=Puia dinghuensis TaxID=1792502 RepID=A0A8J2UIM0_9BACT|nr:adenine deaminase [Puia dinghuensis]GGB23170.1 adenine deaminase [Puia dinghuensis]
MKIHGQLVDIEAQKINPVEIVIESGIIRSVTPLAEAVTPLEQAITPLAEAGAPGQSPAEGAGPYILPGFIDAHVHIESSLLIPAEFARLAVVHGTIATVSDPHEIANVCGLPGVEFMIANGQTVPFYFYFGAPSCVPATRFETAGATLDAAAVTKLLEDPAIKYLSEMMNFPGVLNKDPEVMEKIAAAHRLGKPVDGHAPGLRGEQARQYIAAGISTDHECFTAEEALDKLQAGMKILIREGSAARNFDALIGLLNDWPQQMMFCSDDKHPDNLLAGHIDRLCARAVAAGVPLFNVLRAACLNPVEHYRLDTGLLRPGDAADFILVEDLQNFRVLETYIKGQLVARDGQTRIASTQPAPAATPAPTAPTAAATPGSPAPGAPAGSTPINNFKATPRIPADFAYPLDKWGEQENVEQVYCIEALDGQLITNKLVIPVADTLPREGRLHANPAKDILKIVVVNRYQPAPVAKSFIKNFGLKRGAIAASVAHDSHNIVAIGVDDESLCLAVNLIIAQKGGLACIDPGAPASAPASGPGVPAELILPLPVAGLMSTDDGYRVAAAYTAIDQMAKNLGSTLGAPFMTLSFMALLVIPHLKLGDMGLFDGDKFALL